jgi:Rrf2 family nitric oxide-sensitive transcriptional repressor
MQNALRVLMFAHAADGRLVTIEQMADAYAISRAHMMKVVNTLTRAGYLTAVRGRSGGIQLPSPTCFSTGNRCVITKCCKLQGVLDETLKAFSEVLDRHTLASIALRPKEFRSFLEPAS